ncbi:MAG: hypothetical protein ACXABY_19535 [Candidatus Thorarchaeota archaeon]|jgi:hypothetical protein
MFISVNTDILDRKTLAEAQLESENQKTAPLRWRVGKTLLVTGLFLIAAMIILGVYMSHIAAYVGSTTFPQFYSDFMLPGLVIGFLLAAIGFAAITSSPGNLSKDGVWSLQTGPLR